MFLIKTNSKKNKTKNRSNGNNTQIYVFCFVSCAISCTLTDLFPSKHVLFRSCCFLLPLVFLGWFILCFFISFIFSGVSFLICHFVVLVKRTFQIETTCMATHQVVLLNVDYQIGDGLLLFLCSSYITDSQFMACFGCGEF